MLRASQERDSCLNKVCRNALPHGCDGPHVISSPAAAGISPGRAPAGFKNRPAFCAPSPAGRRARGLLDGASPSARRKPPRDASRHGPKCPVLHSQESIFLLFCGGRRLLSCRDPCSSGRRATRQSTGFPWVGEAISGPLGIHITAREEIQARMKCLHRM